VKQLKTRTIILYLLAICLAGNNSATQGSGEDLGVKLARPTASQAAWQDTEIGMFICLGLWSWPIGVTEDLGLLAETQKEFNPTELDTDQWVRVAESMGAKYVLYTAKHGDGFCMWQTDTTDFSIKNTPWRDGKGDIVAELAASCRKRGMKLAIYHDAADMYFGAGLGGKCATAEKQEQYNKIFRQQLTELLSNYGDIFEVWFDGSLVVPVEDILEKYAPNAMVFQSPQATIRWVGHEEGFAPYPAWNAVHSGNASVQSGHSTARHGDPDGDRWLPLECDARIRATWMYEADNADTLKSLDYLMDMYYRSVGHGAVLLLNNTPDTTGLIPETDVKRSAELGAEIKRRFGQSIAETSGEGEVVELELGEPVTIDHVITMEDILQGERIREYVIEGLIDGNWEQVVDGISIGHKKIDRFDPVAVESVRIRVTQSAAEPIIRKLAVYNVSGEDVTVKLTKPTPQQAAWQDLELGMFIHFGLWTWTVEITTDMDVLGEVQRNFNPVGLDTDQWVDVAESMGAKYIIYTAKHHDGFCMWQTDTTDFSIKNTPWRDGRGDIMADLARSCKKRGMKLGVYLNGQNAYTGTGLGGKCATPEAQQAYNKMYRQQLTELLTRYGDMVEVWFDGSLVVPVKDILEAHAPNAMVFQSPQATIRWVGNEDGFADYPAWNSVDWNNPVVQAGNSTGKHGDPDGNRWLPLECDARIRANWMYQDDNSLKSLDYLMEMYYGSVGRGAVLLLNNTPDTTGLIPETDAKRSAEFGAEIRRRFGRSIARTQGKGRVVELSFDKPTTIDHVITMEDIRQGERVRKYVVEGYEQGDWRTIAEGISIGHKKIDRIDPVVVSKVRLRVTKCSAQPIIRELAAYNTATTRNTQTGIFDESPKTPGRDSQVVFTWGPEHIKPKLSKWEFDLSDTIDEPTQYELVFRKTAGADDLQIESVVLLLNGMEVPGFTERLEAHNTFNINITGTPSRKKDSIRFRAMVQGAGGTDSFGEVIIRKRSIN
jgi:alpha-L-fucosidase